MRDAQVARLKISVVDSRRRQLRCCKKRGSVGGYRHKPIFQQSGVGGFEPNKDDLILARLVLLLDHLTFLVTDYDCLRLRKACHTPLACEAMMCPSP